MQRSMGADVRPLRPMRYGIALLAFIAANGASAQGFDATVKDGDEFWARFCGKADDLSIDITASGTVTVRTPRQKTVRAKVPLWKDEYLEWTWTKPYQGDVLIAFEASNGDAGRGGVCRFQFEPLTRKWCTRIYGFNVMASVGPDNSLYVGSIDFVGRIHAVDGKYVWQHRGLYKKDPAFNSIGVPLIDNDTVAFPATAGTGPLPDRRLLVDRQTGAIKSIETMRVAERSNIGLQRTRGSCAPRAADPGR